MIERLKNSKDYKQPSSEFVKESKVESINRPENVEFDFDNDVEKKASSQSPNISGFEASQVDQPSLANQSFGGYKQIESILEEGLADFYYRMNPVDQQKFKVRGEIIARKIAQIVSKPSYKPNKIVELIKKWLALIPGVNKFFIEQISKIKADKIKKINL